MPPTPKVLPVPDPAPSTALGEGAAAGKGLAQKPATSGRKRKRAEQDSDAQPVKKILGDGTRSPTCPVTWKSALTGIIIKYVHIYTCTVNLISFLSMFYMVELDIINVIYTVLFRYIVYI